MFYHFVTLFKKLVLNLLTLELMESSRYLLYYSHGLATFGKKYYFLLLFWLQCLILGLFCVGPDFLFQIQLNEWWRWKKKIYLPCVFFRKILIFGWFWYLLITVNLGHQYFREGTADFLRFGFVTSACKYLLQTSASFLFIWNNLIVFY